MIGSLIDHSLEWKYESRFWPVCKVLPDFFVNSISFKRNLTIIKTKYTALIVILIGFFTACGTENSNHSNIYGTWKIDGPQHATWIGGAKGNNRVTAMVTRIYRSATASGDSTVVDSTVTMTYPNADFSAVMTTPVGFPGTNISLVITDHQIPLARNITLHLDSTQASLGDNFNWVSGSGTLLQSGGYTLAPNYYFDCSNPVQPTSGNLRYVVDVLTSDSVHEEFQYNLRLEGIQQAAERVACN